MEDKEQEQRDVPATECIEMFLHCAQCLKEKPAGISPRDWAKIGVGWTKIGLQVWCNRHEINICHIDFEGMQHPANTARYTPPDHEQTVQE